mmetsp:Transcript_284/g.886  ORF Transcript_284/g.886 Transcript_284/m.886 type:complete len:124 (-) Transcript_284:120-491(-)
MGICYVLLHIAEKGWPVPGLMSDIEGTLRLILALEMKETGKVGPGGWYPKAVGDHCKQPLVHWCHGSPGAIFLFCKAYQVLVEQRHLEAAQALALGPAAQGPWALPWAGRQWILPPHLVQMLR